MDREPERPLPRLDESQYPTFVQSEAERIRWQLSVGIAEAIFGGDQAAVWMGARSIFKSDLPT